MGRRKQNPEDSAKRHDILKVAGKMFMTQGFHAVSMDALAEAVPVSKRTLYNHFKDKSALFAAVMQARCEQVFDTYNEILQHENNVKKALMDLARQFTNLVFEPDAINIYRTAITESQRFPALGEMFYEMGPGRSAQMLAEYFKKTTRAGTFKVQDAELAATTFFSMLANRVHMKCMLGLKKRVAPAEREKIVAYAVDVFIKGHA